MMLLRILIPTRPPHVSHSCGVGVTYEFVKQYTIPQFDSGINFHTDIFGASNESDALQDKRLKTITCSAFHV